MTDNQFYALALLLVITGALLGYTLGGPVWCGVLGIAGYLVALLLDFLPPA